MSTSTPDAPAKPVPAPKAPAEPREYGVYLKKDDGATLIWQSWIIARTRQEAMRLYVEEQGEDFVNGNYTVARSSAFHDMTVEAKLERKVSIG